MKVTKRRHPTPVKETFFLEDLLEICWRVFQVYSRCPLLWRLYVYNLLCRPKVTLMQISETTEVSFERRLRVRTQFMFINYIRGLQFEDQGNRVLKQEIKGSGDRGHLRLDNRGVWLFW